jgi:hypothetical protein
VKRLTITIGILFLSIICFGQTEILDIAKLKFELPNGQWKRNDGEFKNPNVFNYEREEIVDNEGQHIIPVIAFIAEDIPDSTDLVLYSARKRGGIPFKIEEVFTWKDKKPKLKYENAIGYKATYDDNRQGGQRHTIYIVHFISVSL